jgi:soluble lytic murein transglycosylase-like protein/TolA-binding protein
VHFLLLAALTAIAAPDQDALRTAARVGDCARVLSLLGDPPPADLTDAQRLLAARCAARTGADQQAEALMAAALAAPTLTRWAALMEAEVHLASADPAALPSPADAAIAERALAHLGAGGLTPELDLRARLLGDKALIAQDRGLEARDDLRALLETELAPEARYWLAWAAEQRGEPGPAAAAYLATWIRHAASPWSERAAQRLAALGQPVPALDSAEGRAQALDRVQVLRQARHPAEALALLRLLEAAGSPPDARLRAEICFEGRDYACAVEAFAALGSPASVGPETLFDHAVATYRAGDPEGAARLYTALYQRHPGTPQGDEASFKIGYAAVDQGQLEEAIAAFEAHLGRFPSSRHADEARWYLGWCHHKLGHPAEAVAAWERLLKAHPTSSLAVGAAYWSAVDGPPGARDAALARVAERWPESGQAWFALQRLGRLTAVPAAPIPALPPLPAAYTAANPRAADADALLAVGLDDYARADLGAVIPAAKGADRPTRLAVARRLADLGEVQRARSLAGVGCAAPEADPQAREICLPRPHAAVVAEVLAGSDLDPYLPYAIMTAESAMDPAVVSPAGARGLMQLMPEVGGRLHAERFPDRPFDPDSLTLGAYNAALGTLELRRLHEHYRALGYRETLPMVIAAYNGGQAAVDRWLEAAGPNPALDAWAEDISFSETRRYVRRVLGVLRAYHRGY